MEEKQRNRACLPRSLSVNRELTVLWAPIRRIPKARSENKHRGQTQGNVQVYLVL